HRLVAADDSDVYYGCLNARPRARRLARVGDIGAVSRAFEAIPFAALAGRFAGIVQESGLRGAGPDDVTVSSISVFDLRSGRAIVLDPQAPNPRAPNPGAESTVGGFVLNDRGWFAWIAGLTVGTGSTTFDVHSHDTTGNHVWDTGSNADPVGALDIGRHSFTWSHAGAIRAAPLA
ncbi:MAG: hypothetical protein M3155_06700, partial [Actinomycetota bacterium]|nr:hypothetical protein [Actinomycetota bacterium]